MAKKVYAGVSCNPLASLEERRSGMLQYATEASILEIGYTEYKAQDDKIGAMHEINKAERLGKEKGANYKLEDEKTNLDFMPNVAFQDYKHPEGYAKLDKNGEVRKEKEDLLKTMGLNLETLCSTLVASVFVPAIGTKEWLPFRKAFIASGGKASEEKAFRTDLVKGSYEKQQGMNNVTNMSVGYFGRIDDKLRTSPAATYYSMLEMINTASNPLDFNVKSDNLDINYKMSSFTNRTVLGFVPGNKKKRIGYSTIRYIDDDNPDNTFVDPDKSDEKTYIYDPDKAANPTYRVIIRVQDNIDSYKELILNDFNQGTKTSNSGDSKVTYSGEPSKEEREAEDFDMKESYISKTFIPLTKSAMRKARLFDRQNLLIETKCSVTQVLQVEEVKTRWWQKGWFKVLTFVAGAILNFFLPGSGTVLQSLINMAVQMAIAYAINLLVDALVKAGIITNGYVAAALKLGLTVGAGYAAGVLGVGNTASFELMSMKTVNLLMNATSDAFNYERMINSQEYKEKMAELKAEEDRIDDKIAEEGDFHTPEGLGRLMLDLDRMLSTVSAPFQESRDEFLLRTTRVTLVTEEPSYHGLKGRLTLDK